MCLGYVETNKVETMSESERNAIIDECFAYDDVLRRNGHFAGGEPLQGPQTAKTLRWKKGKLRVIDGPRRKKLSVEFSCLRHRIWITPSS